MRLPLAALGVAALLLLAGAMSAQAASPTFTPVADTFSSQPNPTSTNGSVSYIKAQAGTGQVRNGYLKFTISGLTAPVGRATLRLWTLTGDAVGFDVRSVADTTWSESTLTWQNAPPFSSTVTGSSGPFASGAWVSVDVTPLITGNGTFSLALTTTDTTGLQVASKDGNASQRPQLVIDPAVAPANTSLPTISGTPTDGQTLTASPGTWSGFPSPTLGYQWRRCDSGGNNCADIAGATASTYRVTSGDVGSTFRVAVTGTNIAGSATAVSAATGSGSAAGPTNTALPTITGVLQANQTLTASTGTWSGTAPITYAYQWRSCDSGGNNCADIFGATASTYTLGATDVGNTVRVVVTATNGGGSSSATSNAVGPVGAAVPPVNTAPPTVSGTAQDGQTLTANPGTWSSQPAASYSYQWTRCDSTGASCSSISGATAQTYALTSSDVGSTIRISVTATNPSGSTVASSDPTQVVAGIAPANATAPSISGTPQVGSTLTADHGTWNGTTPITFAYQWMSCDTNGANCTQIAGATNQTYAPASSDVGSTLVVSVTATNVTASTSASSAAVGPVTLAPVPPANTNPPTISGIPQEDQTLTADPGTWTGQPTPTLTYQWQQCDAAGECNDIPGATSSTFTVGDESIGAEIRVVVTGTSIAGTVSAASAQTDPIASAVPVAPANTLDPSISGTAIDNGVQTATPGTWTGKPTPTFSYQWLRCNASGASCTTIVGAAGVTYMASFLDVGSTLRVNVTGTNSVGSATATSPATGVIAESSYPQMVLRDNPRGYWRLEETSGTTATDLGSANNKGTYQGGYTLGVNGALIGGDKAAHLNGVDGKVMIGDPSNGSLDFGTGDFTVEAWFRTTVNGDEAILGKQSVDAGTAFWQVTVTANSTYIGRIRAKISDGTTTRTAFGPALRVDDGKWHYVAVRYIRNSGINIFVDGLSSFTSGPLTTSVDNSANLRIGYAGGYPYFNGDVDEVAVYPQALPDNEIFAHYSGGIDTTPPAVTLTNLPDGTATNSTAPLFVGTGGAAIGDSSTVQVKVYSGTSATGTPIETLAAQPDGTGAWSVRSNTLSNGTYTAKASQSDSAGNTGTSTANTFTVTSDPVIAAAGDISCDPAYNSYNGGNGTATNCREKYTSNLLVNQGLSGVLTLGDNQYDCGSPSAFAQAYDPTWGRLKAITHPAPGNHEYEATSSGGCDENGQALGYFNYFGAAAGDPSQGYYSFDLGTWHIISMNSNCHAIGGCGPGSAEEQWLQQDLAAHPAQCTLAYWHHPRFTSDAIGDNPGMAAFWQDLYNAGADVVLNGHAHEYERFAPQDPSENLDPSRGIRELVVGTGGNSYSSFAAVDPNSEVRNNKTYGVLELTLHPNGYDWKFVPEAGKTFTDSGSGTCH